MAAGRIKDIFAGCRKPRAIQSGDVAVARFMIHPGSEFPKEWVPSTTLVGVGTRALSLLYALRLVGWPIPCFSRIHTVKEPIIYAQCIPLGDDESASTLNTESCRMSGSNF